MGIWSLYVKGIGGELMKKKLDLRVPTNNDSIDPKEKEANITAPLPILKKEKGGAIKKSILLQSTDGNLTLSPLGSLFGTLINHSSFLFGSEIPISLIPYEDTTYTTLLPSLFLSKLYFF
jgi:hypothetical protein